jgi:hypothetical protein
VRMQDAGRRPMVCTGKIQKNRVKKMEGRSAKKLHYISFNRVESKNGESAKDKEPNDKWAAMTPASARVAMFSF